MLINEILDPNNKDDLMDIIASQFAHEIDKFCDTVEFISNNGNTPIEYLNQELIHEVKMQLQNTFNEYVSSLHPTSKLLRRMKNIKNYLDGA